MNKKLSTIFLIAAGIIISSPVFAAVSIPTIAGIPRDATAAEFIVYFFNLAIAVGGLIAVVIIISAGVEYITAQGEPGKIESAKKKIQNTLLGVAVLLASYIVLNIINPSLTTIKINDLSKEPQQNQTTETIKQSGVYLYKAQGDPLIFQDTKASLVQDNFNGQAQSVKFINAADYKYAAILFTNGDLRGNCSYAFEDINDLGVAVGNQNSPAIGKNSVNSVQVFKIKTGSPTVKLYNNINCAKRSDEYGKIDERTSVCTVSMKDGFTNIKESCPDFIGNVLSIGAGSDTGVLLKAANKDAPGKCQFFTSGNSTCINTIKYSYVYNPDPSSPIKPLSYVLFPLYIEQ